MTSQDRAKATVEAVRAIEHWAKALQIALPTHFAVDIAEIGRAAGAIQESVARLASQPPLPARDAGRSLVALHGWLYDELPDHTRRLRASLEKVTALVYALESDQAPGD